MNNTHSPAAHGPELTPNTAAATACRRAFRRRSALRLPEDRTEQPTMPEDFAARPEAGQPTAAPAPSLYAQAVAARDALQRAAAGLTVYRQALAGLRQVADALLMEVCGPRDYAPPSVRPFLAATLDAQFHDLEQGLRDTNDAAFGQAALLCRLARELEEEVLHA